VKLKNMGFNMTSNLNEIENILGELKNGKKNTGIPFGTAE
jgi:hypothetical protein